MMPPSFEMDPTFENMMDMIEELGCCEDEDDLKAFVDVNFLLTNTSMIKL